MRCEIREVSLTALATMYVSWNCNQTFITEKLNAYSRSSSTRGEGPSLASKSVEEIVFSVLLLLRASYKKYVAFLLHLHTFDYDPKLATEDTNTNIQIHHATSYHDDVVGGHFQIISIHLIFQTLV